MKKFLIANRINANVFCIFLYMFFMLFSFDSFCFDSITTETPLLKIGELPMLRTDFVSLLFSLTFIIGAIIGVILRIKGKSFSSLLTTLLGIIALILVFFDVDTLQILAPTMRISHVIMTLSRISAILLGASGIIVGLALSLLESEKHTEAVIAGILTAVLLSLLACQEKLYTLSFVIVSLMLLFAGIVGQFFNNDMPIVSTRPALPESIFKTADKFFSVFVLTATSLTLNGYLTTSMGYGYSAYFICIFAMLGSFVLAKRLCCKAALLSSAIAIVLSGMAIAFRPYVMILLACLAIGFAAGCSRHNNGASLVWDPGVCAIAVFIGAIVSYYVVHDMSQIMTFSANRIVYLVQSNLFIPITVAMSLKLLCSAINVIINIVNEKKGGNNDNPVTVE